MITYRNEDFQALITAIDLAVWEVNHAHKKMHDYEPDMGEDIEYLTRRFNDKRLNLLKLFRAENIEILTSSRLLQQHLRLIADAFVITGQSSLAPLVKDWLEGIHNDRSRLYIANDIFTLAINNDNCDYVYSFMRRVINGENKRLGDALTSAIKRSAIHSFHVLTELFDEKMESAPILELLIDQAFSQEKPAMSRHLLSNNKVCELALSEFLKDKDEVFYRKLFIHYIEQGDRATVRRVVEQHYINRAYDLSDRIDITSNEGDERLFQWFMYDPWGDNQIISDDEKQQNDLVRDFEKLKETISEKIPKLFEGYDDSMVMSSCKDNDFLTKDFRWRAQGMLYFKAFLRQYTVVKQLNEPASKEYMAILKQDLLEFSVNNPISLSSPQWKELFKNVNEHLRSYDSRLVGIKHSIPACRNSMI